MPVPDQAVLIVIDLQNDFCPGGSLAVADGNAIVPNINRISHAFQHIVLTQDWHPSRHHSFASSHAGHAAFDSIEAPYGMQTLWPDHCVQKSVGANFHPDLETDRADLILRKGFRTEIDSYSAFFENDHSTPTGLTGYLRERGLSDLFFCGIATDFCVAWSALDACKQGFNATVLEDACAAIDLEGSLDTALSNMRNAGVTLANSQSISS